MRVLAARTLGLLAPLCPGAMIAALGAVCGACVGAALVARHGNIAALGHACAALVTLAKVFFILFYYLYT